jgi:K(+)-stimulated pyrophosphate-energized sodium pump
MNPAIKFTTLFGLLAAEVAIEMGKEVRIALAAATFVVALVFVWRTFYAMRIGEETAVAATATAVGKTAGRAV